MQPLSFQRFFISLKVILLDHYTNLYLKHLDFFYCHFFIKESWLKLIFYCRAHFNIQKCLRIQKTADIVYSQSSFQYILIQVNFKIICKSYPIKCNFWWFMNFFDNWLYNFSKILKWHFSNLKLHKNVNYTTLKTHWHNK